RESDLAGRLANPNGTPEPRVSSDPLQDYQLGEALNLLKALNVLERLPAGAGTPAAANDS
ncbi:MAG TPA: peptidase S41, partial [Modicisalibacter sp.]|nr:peptidase S41 [Modicisalibacter sp.]